MRALIPIAGSSLLFLAACGAGYLALNTSFPATSIIDRTTNVSKINDVMGNAETPRLIPPVRPEIYFSAITARPVFEKSRRPVRSVPEVDDSLPAPELEPIIIVEPEPEVEIPRPNLLLLGVLTGGAHNSALISVDGADPEWIRQGTEIAGWVLTMIEANTIKLNEDDRSLRIDLYRK